MRKQRIAKSIYFNPGLSFAFSFGECGNKDLKEQLVEFGVPLLFEFGNISKNKATIYGGIGIVPTYYKTIKEEYVSENEHNNTDEDKNNFRSLCITSCRHRSIFTC